MQQRLYGVVGMVNSKGVSKVIPVFKELDAEKYYCLKQSNNERRVQEQIDITRYGEAKSLPISNLDITKAEEFFIIWEADKCLQRGNGILAPYWGEDMINLAASWVEFNIHIGICDNMKFMLCKAETEKEMEKLYLQSK